MKRFKLIKELPYCKIGDIAVAEVGQFIWELSKKAVPYLFDPHNAKDWWEEISECPYKEGDWIFVKDWGCRQAGTERPTKNIFQIKSIKKGRFTDMDVDIDINGINLYLNYSNIDSYIRKATPEEISESTKDWEILEFKFRVAEEIFKLIDDKYSNGCYSYSLNSMLHYANCLDSIHTVKCLSTGEILTVGDDTNFGVIEKFFIIQNNMMINMVSDNETSYKIVDIRIEQLIKKVVKKPIFTTLDGVDIFEGMPYAILFCNKITTIPKAEKNSGRNVKIKYFSTKEAAQLYLIENTDCLSFKDVEKYIINKFAEEELKKIIKQKLKIK